MSALDSLIDFSQPTLYVAMAGIAFNPTFWNIVARAEYRHHVITNLFGGNRLNGCYALAATIFLLGLLRDYLYSRPIFHPRGDI